VSAADKLHNARAVLRDVRTTGLSTFERFNAGRDGMLWYFRALVQAFRAHGSHPLVDELERVVTAVERAVERAVAAEEA